MKYFLRIKPFIFGGLWTNLGFLYQCVANSLGTCIQGTSVQRTNVWEHISSGEQIFSGEQTCEESMSGEQINSGEQMSGEQMNSGEQISREQMTGE